jgi:hypothetical protein
MGAWGCKLAGLDMCAPPGDRFDLGQGEAMAIDGDHPCIELRTSIGRIESHRLRSSCPTFVGQLHASATDGQKAALKLVGGSPLLIPVGKTTVPNLAFEVHDEMSLIVLKHGPGAPSGQEWTRYLDAFGPVAHRLEQMRILAIRVTGARSIPSLFGNGSAHLHPRRRRRRPDSRMRLGKLPISEVPQSDSAPASTTTSD